MAIQIKPTKTTTSRNGLSLLEVILSIAILGVSMVAIGHLFNLGFRSAADMQLRSEANMIADTTMAEIAAGVLDYSSNSGSVDSNPQWQYDVKTQPSEQPGLLSVTVRVSPENDSNSNVSVSLVRLIADPDFEREQPTAAYRGSGTTSGGATRRSSSSSSAGSSTSSGIGTQGSGTP